MPFLVAFPPLLGSWMPTEWLSILKDSLTSIQSPQTETTSAYKLEVSLAKPHGRSLTSYHELTFSLYRSSRATPQTPQLVDSLRLHVWKAPVRDGGAADDHGGVVAHRGEDVIVGKAVGFICRAVESEPELAKIPEKTLVEGLYKATDRFFKARPGSRLRLLPDHRPI